MKTKYTLLLVFTILSLSGYSKTWTITNSNFTFSPETLNISNGDSVKYVLDAMHNAREVSQSTWQANSNSALSDGFQTEFGGGLVLPIKLTVGTHWYVCAPHASLGMKGVIIVSSVTAIQDYKSEFRVVLYPNPASNFLSITSKNDVVGLKYYVSNIVGNQILKGTISSSNASIDIRELPKGVYFLQLSGSEKQMVKFIKN